MAGNQLRMTPDTMRRRAGEVRNQGDNVEQAIAYLRRLIVDELPTEWEGAASRAFAEQFLRLEPAFKEMREIVYQVGTQLDHTANETEALDEAIARQFNG